MNNNGQERLSICCKLPRYFLFLVIPMRNIKTVTYIVSYTINFTGFVSSFCHLLMNITQSEINSSRILPYSVCNLKDLFKRFKDQFQMQTENRDEL